MGLSGLAVAALLAAPGSTRILVTDVKPRIGVAAALAQGLTDYVAAEVRRRAKHATVLGADDVRSMVGLENEKQKLGCQEVSCLAELGGALGASLLVTGSLGRFGSTYLLTLELVDVRAAKVLHQASLKIRSQADDDLLDAVSRGVATLLPGAAGDNAAAPEAAPEGAVTDSPSPHRSHAVAWTLIGVGAAAAVIASIGVVEVVSYLNLNSQLQGGQVSPGTSFKSADSQHQSANAWADASLALAAVVVGCGVGAGFTW